jgi:hypothetical protein
MKPEGSLYVKQLVLVAMRLPWHLLELQEQEKNPTSLNLLISGNPEKV